MADIHLETIEIETGTNPSVAVIWLHGLGADGNDFVPIVQELDLTGCPPIRFVFPHAPTMPVTVNGGYVMRAWYDILGTDLSQGQDEEGLRKSQVLVEELIAREKMRGIPASRIILAGFSQGCAMTCKPACVIRNGWLACSACQATCHCMRRWTRNAMVPITMLRSSLRTD